MAQSRIEAALLSAGLIDPDQLKAARAHQAKWGGTLSKAIVEKGFASEATLTDTVASSLGLTRAELGLVRRDTAALAKIPVATAEEKSVFPVALRDGGKTLVIAMADPTDIELTDTLLRLTRCRIKAQVAGDLEIAEAIRVHYRGLAPGATAGPLAGGNTPFGEVELGPEGMIADEPEAPPPAVEIEPTAPPVLIEPAAPPMARPRTFTPDPLDDLFGPSGDGPQFTQEDLDRLEKIQMNQRKGLRVLEAVVELCVEKGVISNEEYRDRIKRR
jgi:hypothetical protein